MGGQRIADGHAVVVDSADFGVLATKAADVSPLAAGDDEADVGPTPLTTGYLS